MKPVFLKLQGLTTWAYTSKLYLLQAHDFFTSVPKLKRTLIFTRHVFIYDCLLKVVPRYQLGCS